MKFIKRKKKNKIYGYCFSGWFGSGCNQVCTGNCKQVCNVNLGETETTTKHE